MGTYEFKDKSWRFAFAPEVGARIPMGLEQSWGFNFLIRYQMGIYEKNDITKLRQSYSAMHPLNNDNLKLG